MRKLFTILLLLLSLKISAQTIKVDSSDFSSYVNIDSIQIGFLKGTPLIDRLYVRPQEFSRLDGVTFHWQLKYKNFRPDSSIFYLPVGGIGDGFRTIPINTTDSFITVLRDLYKFTGDSILNVTLH